MNTDAKEHALTPEQAKTLKESLENISNALTVEEKDREPGKPYIKHIHRVTHEPISIRDPETGEDRLLTDAEREAQTTVDETVRYYPDFRLKWGEYLCDPGKGWTLEDYEHYEERMQEYAETGTVQTQWGRLMPLTEEIERPEFPLKSLPEPYARYTRALAESLQVPVDMVGVSVLGLLGGCLQKRYEINAKNKFTVPLGLYTLVVADPGERKSSVYDEVVRPVKDYEQKLWSEYQKAQLDYELEQELAEEEFKKTKQQYMKCKDATERESLKAALLELKEKIAFFQKKCPPCLYMDDTTNAALEQELARNGGRMIIMSDEGDLFANMMGLYTGGQHTLGAMLKGHTGGSSKTHRVGRDPVRLPASNLSVLLMVQPIIIDTIMADAVMRGRGMNARFLYTMPKSRVGDRNIETAKDIDPKIDADYYNAVYSLYADNHITLEPKPRQLVLKDSAQMAYMAYETMFERRLKGDMKDLSDWGSKLGGEMLRLVGILHCAAHPDAIMETPIAKETVDQAHQLAKYFSEYARIIYNMGSGLDPNMRVCQRIVEVIKAQGIKIFSKTELFGISRMGCKKISDLLPYLNILEDYGYLKSGRFTNGNRTFTGYEVNPAVFEDGEQIHNNA
ncbi:YfjI family protein [Eubacterium sp. 1001713B170207_170306_E7]|uniref:YfjI family protein n=1 Tax=Eubacterium sp. 1001713B170207_170306_E7 TaxID=2787097 RepID=UPI001896C4C3|nr:YfjI family protein [Eubacterium sp. 1001713B170207_170306_E7]